MSPVLGKARYLCDIDRKPFWDVGSDGDQIVGKEIDIDMNKQLQSCKGEGRGSVDHGRSGMVPASAVQASAFTVEPLVSSGTDAPDLH